MRIKSMSRPRGTQRGAISGSILTMLISGLVIIGLLAYGAVSGHELPLWPAIVVVLVNVVAAGKVFLDARKARKLRQSQADSRK
jgi:Na+/proline symporter